MMPPERLRVLISAHEFSPYQGSECTIGWQVPLLMANFHDVTVLCASGPPQNPDKYRNDLSRYLEENGPIPPGLEVVFVGQPATTLWCARLNKLFFNISDGVGYRPLFYLGYNAWQRATLKKALELGASNFDLVHQLVPLSFRCPGYLWKLNVPFFWGPIGGMYKVPGTFPKWISMRFYLSEVFRSVCNKLQSRLSMSVRGAAQKAILIWTVTDDERRMVNRIAGNKGVLMIETASRPEVSGYVRQYDGQRPLRICWSGHHIALKALPLLLYALALLPEPQMVVLDIFGNGSETQGWRKLAVELGLKKFINWHGWLKHDEAIRKMSQADVLVHTSIREGTPNVVLEALSWGIPVICHDICGMAIAVDDTCGIKIPFVNPDRSIEEIRRAIKSILDNQELIEKLSEGALHRSAMLTWDAKVRQMAETYSRYVKIVRDKN